MSVQTENVPPLTYRLLEVAGDAERAAFLCRLAGGEATAKQLREPADQKRTGGNRYLRRPVEQTTGARHLIRLTDVGLVEPGEEPNTYRLTCPEETRELLEAANRLALAVGRSGVSGDETIDHDLRKARIKPARDGDSEIVTESPG